MRAILMFHNCRGKVTRQCPQTTAFEENRELKRIRTEVPLLTSLTPYRLAKSAHQSISQLGRPYLETQCPEDDHTPSLTFRIAWLFRPSKSVNMVLNVHRNNKAYWGRENGWKGVWRWGKREIIYYWYTVTTRMTPAFRWAATRPILMFH